MSIEKTYANKIGSAQADVDAARIKGSIIANEGLVIARQQIQQNQIQNIELQNKIEELEEEVDEYRKLLCKPMLEIANQNRNFKATYEAQMQIMAEWMVSQKAFKELAIQFGFEKNLSPEKIMEMGDEKKLDVLDNKHEKNHGTNENGIPLIGEFKEKIKTKIKEKLKG